MTSDFCLLSTLYFSEISIELKVRLSQCVDDISCGLYRRISYFVYFVSFRTLPRFRIENTKLCILNILKNTFNWYLNCDDIKFETLVALRVNKID